MGTREGDVEWNDREREIQVTLTTEEVLFKAHRVSAIHAEINALDSDMKRIVKAKRGRMEELRSELATSLHAISTNKEPRTVMVKEMLDYKTCRVETWFDGDKVEERTMEPAERQLGIDQAIEGMKKVKKPKQDAFAFKAGDETAENSISPQVVDESHLDEKGSSSGGEPLPTEGGEPVSTELLTSPPPAGVERLVYEGVDEKTGATIRRVTDVVTTETDAERKRNAALEPSVE